MTDERLAQKSISHCRKGFLLMSRSEMTKQEALLADLQQAWNVAPAYVGNIPLQSLIGRAMAAISAQLRSGTPTPHQEPQTQRARSRYDQATLAKHQYPYYPVAKSDAQQMEENRHADRCFDELIAALRALPPAPEQKDPS